MERIAVLGAGGYIGRSLAKGLSGNAADTLVLFTRAPAALKAKLRGAIRAEIAEVHDFDAADFDVVVNAIGAGEPSQVHRLGAELIRITEEWDNRVLDSLDAARGTLYVFLSSGIVYGEEFASPAGPDSCVTFRAGGAKPPSPYFISKYYAEWKHRWSNARRIVDARIFGYADDTLDLKAQFLLADIARALLAGRPLVTNPVDFQRDYVGGKELVHLIECCRKQASINAAFDVYSLAPVGKFALLDLLGKLFGLSIEVKPGAAGQGSAGVKSRYFSTVREASKIGYAPDRTAAAVVCDALAKLCKK